MLTIEGMLELRNLAQGITSCPRCGGSAIQSRTGNGLAEVVCDQGHIEEIPFFDLELFLDDEARTWLAAYRAIGPTFAPALIDSGALDTELGTWFTFTHPAGEMRHPVTGADVAIAARTNAHFLPAPQLLETIPGPHLDARGLAEVLFGSVPVPAARSRFDLSHVAPLVLAEMRAQQRSGIGGIGEFVAADIATHQGRRTYVEWQVPLGLRRAIDGEGEESPDPGGAVARGPVR